MNGKPMLIAQAEAAEPVELRHLIPAESAYFYTCMHADESHHRLPNNRARTKGWRPNPLRNWSWPCTDKRNRRLMP